MTSYARSFTTLELANKLHASLHGREDLLICAVSDIENATPEDVSFFHNEKYQHLLAKTKAGAIIAKAPLPGLEHLTWIIHENPSLAFQQAIELFCPNLDTKPYRGIHPTAIVDPSATVELDVTLAPHVVIGPRCSIGQGTYIGPGSILSADVAIAENCLIHPGVIIRESCTIGARVILQPGVIIGSCGFGYNTIAGTHNKLQHVGRVVIEEDVEIGAGSCIDRARFKETRIRRGSKIDNLVMIAHGVEVGEDNLLVAQVGIAGSTKTGRWVVLGGQVGVAGHLTIEDGTQVAAQAGVTKNLSKGIYGGSPACPIRKWHEGQAHLHTIPALKEKLAQLQLQLQALEKQFGSNL